MEPHVFGLLEPEIEKKPGAGATPKKMGAGAGAANIMRLLYRPLENKKHKGIVHLLLFFYVK